MYLRFRAEKPFIAGNSARKSMASRSMILAPALLVPALEDLVAYTPVELDQLLVDRERGTRAREEISALRRRAAGDSHPEGSIWKGLTADHCLHYWKT